MTDKVRVDTLPINQDGEIEMPLVLCPACITHTQRMESDSHYRRYHAYHEPRITVECKRGNEPTLTSQIRLTGVIVCLDDNHRLPIVVENNITRYTAPDMPVNEGHVP